MVVVVAGGGVVAAGVVAVVVVRGLVTGGGGGGAGVVTGCGAGVGGAMVGAVVGGLVPRPAVVVGAGRVVGGELGRTSDGVVVEAGVRRPTGPTWAVDSEMAGAPATPALITWGSPAVVATVSGVAISGVPCVGNLPGRDSTRTSLAIVVATVSKAPIGWSPPGGPLRARKPRISAAAAVPPQSATLRRRSRWASAVNDRST